MSKRVAMVLGGLVLAIGIIAYVGYMLQQYGQECDSTLRHCDVSQEEIAFLEGQWCAAIDPRALRERIVFEEERIMLLRDGALAERDDDWREMRVFASMGAIVYFEHDLETGARLTGELTLRMDGPDRRFMIDGPHEIEWVRCAES